MNQLDSGTIAGRNQTSRPRCWLLALSLLLFAPAAWAQALNGTYQVGAALANDPTQAAPSPVCPMLWRE